MGKHTSRPLSMKGLALSTLAILFLGGVGAASAFETARIAAEATSVSGASGEDCSQEQKNHSDWLAGQESSVQNYRRELQDVQKDAPNVDASGANSALQTFEKAIADKKSSIGKCGFWNDQAVSDAQRAIDDIFQDTLRPARDLGSCVKNFSNRKRELKDIKNQVKNILRSDKNADVTALNGHISKIEELLTKADSLGTVAGTRDNADLCNDIGSEVNDNFQDFYNSSRDVQDAANSKQRLTDGQKDFEKNIKRNCEKDKARELKNFEKELAKAQKSGTTLPPEVDTGYKQVKEIYNQQCVVLVQSMQQALQNGDADAFEEARQEYWNTDRDFWDTMNETRNFGNQLQQVKDCSRELKNRKQNLKNMEREYNKVVKGAGKDISELKEHLDAYKDLLTQAEAFVSAPNIEQNCWDDFFQPLGEHEGEFHNVMQSKGRIFQGDFSRWLKDNEREWVKNRPQEIKQFEREAKSDGGNTESVGILKDILAKAQALLSEARKAYEGGDAERVEEILNQDLQELRFQWEEVTRNFYDKRQAHFEQFELKRILEMLKTARKEFKQLIEQGNDEASTCLALVDRAEEIMPQMIKAMESGDEGRMEELKNEVDRLEQESEATPICKEVFDRLEGKASHGDVRQFVNEFQVGVPEDRLEAILQKVNTEFVDKVLERVATRLNQALLERLANVEAGLQAQIASLLQATSSFVPEQYQEEILSEKAEILDLGQHLKAISGKSGCDRLNELLKRIEKANVVGDSADELKGLMEDFAERASGLSGKACSNAVNDLYPKVDAVVFQGQEELFEKGIIPFKDTGVDSFYTPAVYELAKRGIISGRADASGKPLGVFDPGREVSIAEMFRMTLEAAGVGKADGSGGICNGKYDRGWASGYAGSAVRSGISLVESCPDLNRNATRGEVVQMILEAAQAVPPIVRASSFSDVPKNHPALSSIEYAKELGIVTGDKAGTFRPNAPINRGEAATIVKRALKIFATPELEEESAPQHENEEYEEDFEEEDFEE